MVELGPRPREDLPGLVAVLAEDDEVVRRRPSASAASASASLQPSAGDEPRRRARCAPPSASASAQPGVLQDGERLAAEDVRVPGELEQGDRGVEVIESQNGTCVVGSGSDVRS